MSNTDASGSRRGPMGPMGPRGRDLYYHAAVLLVSNFPWKPRSSRVLCIEERSSAGLVDMNEKLLCLMMIKNSSL